MRNILRLLLFFALSFLFLTPASANKIGGELDSVDVFLILKAIESVNKRIDTNYKQSDSSSKEVLVEEEVIEDKLNSLKSAARSIFLGEIRSSEEIELLQEERHLLDVRVRANRAYGYELAIARDSAKIDLIDFTLNAQDFFINLNNLAKSASREIDEVIESELKRVEESIDLNRYSALIENNPNSEIVSTLKTNAHALELRVESYQDLLYYLSKHYKNYITKSAIIIDELNIKEIRDYINSYINFKIWRIGVGEIVVSLAIILFFLSFKKLLARLALIISNKLVNKVTSTEENRSIMRSFEKPLYIFLFIFSIEFSLIAIYYPTTLPEGLKELFFTLEIASICWALIALVSGYGKIMLGNIASKNELLRREVANLIIKTIYFLVVLSGLLLILNRFGVNLTHILASLGIGGLAVALAAKDTLANFFGSIMILVDNTISQGDWIVCGDDEGVVVEIGLRTTAIRTFDNALIFIPNSRLSNESIRNWSRRRVGRRIYMHIGLTYESKKDEIERCVGEIKEMLISHPKIATPQKINLEERGTIISKYDLLGYKNTLLVNLDKFNDFSIDIMVYCFSTTVDWEEWLDIKEDVMLKIMEIVERNGLAFAFPTQSIYLESMPKELDMRSK